MPSGSWNQATLAPPGAVQMPSSSLLEKGIALEDESFGGELFDGAVDVVDLPAEDGVGRRGEVLHADETDHGAVRFHDDGEGVVAEKPEAEDVLIEAEGSFRVSEWG